MTILAYWPPALAALWPILFIVACPVGMWLMMRSMGSMGSGGDASSKNASEIAALRGEVERLRGQPPRYPLERESQQQGTP